MKEEEILVPELKRLITASKNAGGELAQIMKDSLENSKDVNEFEYAWFWNLRNFMNRTVGFYNVLAERTGHEQVTVV